MKRERMWSVWTDATASARSASRPSMATIISRCSLTTASTKAAYSDSDR